jgi:hypothetical protein
VPTLTVEAVCPRSAPGENFVGRWVSSLFPHHEPSPLASEVNPYSLYKRTSMAKPHGHQKEKGIRERPLAEWDSSSLSDISCILGGRSAARLHTGERSKMGNRAGLVNLICGSPKTPAWGPRRVNHGRRKSQGGNHPSASFARGRRSVVRVLGFLDEPRPQVAVGTKRSSGNGVR